MTENKFDYRKILSKYSIVLVLIVIMIACTFANSSFLTANNLINVCRQQSVIIILAFGEMILIICGQLDLSCGSVIALAGVLSVMTYKSTQSMALAFIVAIAVSERINGYKIHDPCIYRHTCHSDNGSWRCTVHNKWTEYL